MVCHVRVALVGWLELEWVQAKTRGPGATTPGCLGGNAVEESGEAGWPSFGEWLELMWAKGLGFAGLAVAGWPEHLDYDPACTIKVEGECKK